MAIQTTQKISYQNEIDLSTNEVIKKKWFEKAVLQDIYSIENYPINARFFEEKFDFSMMIQQNLNLINETFLEKREELRDDSKVVQMPPKKRYTIEVEIVKIKKAKPRIFEPEE
ncbi:MAG: hypothetical protein ACTSXO_07335 [Candidatus Heimdallarchaeota archaeon]|nr:MAG: hypothetical protein DRO63_05050 [Candidatus Gerdarchaeota archaeon]RLI67455.1 MAG: hypothetical protein DRO91_10190 [Candidatus Heimdallarchaeota archaeon]RLI69591.1 MAG: hypothetical protein DRP02_10230 [Candidatus Gerdarchaeota archaeon]